MKALLYHHGARSVMGHSLASLLFELEEFHPELLEHADSLSVLDQYYIPTRYPDALPGNAPFEVYGRDEATQGISIAGFVVDTAKRAIGVR